jgi:hypothetical protein
MNNIKEPVNPWTKEDEREHFPSVIEWWGAEAFFNTVENNKKWSLKTSLSEWFTRPNNYGSNAISTLFDLGENKHFDFYARRDTDKLKSSENTLHVSYDKSFVTGVYPDYRVFFHDPKNNIECDMNYHAEALPHWVAQEVTNGLLPMGMGSFRYGFIPRCIVTGTMKKDDKTFNLEGKGYFEHVWGNFSYTDPLSNLSELKNTASIFLKLFGWWLSNRKFPFPKSLKFSTENNPLGYDWIWALLDNGWSLFYGNALFCFMNGPVAGTLILTKDGKAYTGFWDVNFQYNKTIYAKDYDFYYPSEIELTAQKEKEKLHLCFKMSADSREHLLRFPPGKQFLGFVICELPGSVEGYYINGDKKIPITGVCKLEPQRQVLSIGHNSLGIDFLLPPEGVGVSLDLNSHFMMRNLYTKLQFAPKPSFKFNVKKINKEDVK